jgi:branched-chain amino acid transport system substrate-binding protein
MLGMACLLLTACAPANLSGTDDDTIKIGFLGPLTGDVAAIGNDILDGVKWVVEETNAKGGVNGKKVELVVEDGRCTGSEAASAARKLVDVDKVTAIVGGLCSGETLAAAPIVEMAQVVALSPGSSSPDVTTAGDFVFRNYPSDALKTTAMTKYFREKGYGKIAMISENTDFSQAFRKSLKEKMGAEAVVFDEVVEPGTKDFRSLMSRLAGADFDVFFMNPNSDSAIAIMLQQYREQGMTKDTITHDVGESLNIAQIAGDAANGLKLINVPAAGEGGRFEADYRAKFGDPQASITWAAYGYDAAGILLGAMRSGAANGAAIRDALYALPSYDGIVGTIRFDRNGDVIGIPYALKEFQNGKIVTIDSIDID